jgi:hypothetical protein
VKALDEATRGRLAERGDLADGDALLVVADKEWKRVCEVLGSSAGAGPGPKPGGGGLAVPLGGGTLPPAEWDEEQGRYTAVHHPFHRPQGRGSAPPGYGPGAVRSRAYDLVLNGNEVGGGSIRIHNPQMQERVFQALAFTPEAARSASASSWRPLLRDPAPRRAGPGLRPTGHAPLRRQVHPGSDGLPQDPAGPVPSHPEPPWWWTRPSWRSFRCQHRSGRLAGRLDRSRIGAGGESFSSGPGRYLTGGISMVQVVFWDTRRSPWRPRGFGDSSIRFLTGNPVASASAIPSGSSTGSS